MSSGFASVRCLRCGTYTEGGQFCTSCVESQRTEEAARAERVAESIADATASAGAATGSASASGTLCPACGRFTTAGARFCGHCRYEFITTSEPIEAGLATGQRLIAGLIDGILLFVAFTIMAFALSGTEEGGNGEVVRVGLRNEEYLLYLGIVYVYYVVLELLTSASIGKLLMGLKVVRIDGRPYDVGAILVRNFIRFIDSIPLGLYVVGLITIAVTQKKQRLGDLVVGTTVIKIR